MIRLDSKVAIVTGGAKGIGAATAQLLAELGASVLVADIDREGAKAVVQAISDAGGTAVAQDADLEREADIKAMVERAVDEFGGLDILDNNAALTDPNHFQHDVGIADMDPDIWDRTFDVNVRGTMLACKYAIPHMLQRGGGSIVNIASMMGLGGDVITSAYGSSKAAVLGLTKYVATQHMRDGIRCNAVAPGLIVTPAARAINPPEILEMFERHQTRIGDPIDIAHAVAFLASDWSSLVTGQLLSVDGGMFSHVPMWPERAAFFAPSGD